MNRRRFGIFTLVLVAVATYVFKERIAPFVSQIKSKINL